MLDLADQITVARGLREGDRTAWTTLYDAYSGDVWRYAAKRLGTNESVVADVVQEVFMCAAASARTFDPTRGNLWAWLSGIVHHQVAAHWRVTSRQRTLQEALAELRVSAGAGDGSSGNAESVLAQKELAEVVRFVLAEVAADYASLLVAKYVDEFSLAQLSQQFGISPEAVKSKLARARGEFRVCFERHHQQSRITTSSAAKVDGL